MFCLLWLGQILIDEESAGDGLVHSQNKGSLEQWDDGWAGLSAERIPGLFVDYHNQISFHHGCRNHCGGGIRHSSSGAASAGLPPSQVGGLESMTRDKAFIILQQKKMRPERIPDPPRLFYNKSI